MAFTLYNTEFKQFLQQFLSKNIRTVVKIYITKKLLPIETTCWQVANIISYVVVETTCYQKSENTNVKIEDIFRAHTCTSAACEEEIKKLIQWGHREVFNRSDSNTLRAHWQIQREVKCNFEEISSKCRITKSQSWQTKY